MNKRRLLKLADLLEADAANKKGVRFNLCILGITEHDGEPLLDCGTEACAMGLAALSGKFKRNGLFFKARDGAIDTTINGKRRRYDSAAKHVFDIPLSAAHFLFSPACYPRDKLSASAGEVFVAKRIRDFVAGKTPHSSRQ